MVAEEQQWYGPNKEEEGKLLLRGDVSDLMQRKEKVTPKKISDVLNPNGCYSRDHRIILMEGAPGVGKSTMAWDICRKWGMGELFEEFEIVLFVQLRDEAIQSARSLEDLFPDDLNSNIEAVRAVQDCGGLKVALVLDGWDEFPPGLHGNSIIRKLICSPASLKMQGCVLIITSRPIATAELQRYATFRIEIVGFMQTEVEDYFAQAIRNPQTQKKLKDLLKERPAIKASCYLPMKATIIAHVFLASSNHTLPTTFNEVSIFLVLNCIRRHLPKQAEGERIPDFSSLDELPENIEKRLRSIRMLAYLGVRDKVVTFPTAYLESYNRNQAHSV